MGVVGPATRALNCKGGCDPQVLKYLKKTGLVTKGISQSA